jgi:hypothetical protein
MPTGGERFVWGFGDGSDLDPVDTPYGRVDARVARSMRYRFDPVGHYSRPETCSRL